MGRVADFVVQHLLDNPELIDADVVKEWGRIYEAGEERSVQLTQYLSLFKASLPEHLMTVSRAWDVISALESNISRGVQVKEKGLVPGMKVRVGSEEYTVRTIGRDYSVHLQGRAGGHHPLSMEPLVPSS